MNQTINEPVSVIAHYDAQTNKNWPVKLKWRNRIYLVEKIGLHHQLLVGQNLHHIFAVTSRGLYFKLKLDTQNLSWKLEEIDDGEVD